MTAPWQLFATWGVLVGLGCGARRDRARRRRSPTAGSSSGAGSWSGMLTASNASGQLVFLPLLARLAERPRLAQRVVRCWRRAMAVLIPLVVLLLPETPRHGRARGRTARADGASADARASRQPDHASRSRGLATRRAVARFLAAVRQLLHLRLHHQRPGRHAPDRLLRRPRHPRGRAPPACWRMMGVFDLIGTTVSGWLTDRLQLAEAAVLVLRPARPVADRPAVHRLRRRSACRCSRCSTASTGSPPCRRPWR